VQGQELHDVAQERDAMADDLQLCTEALRETLDRLEYVLEDRDQLEAALRRLDDRLAQRDRYVALYRPNSTLIVSHIIVALFSSWHCPRCQFRVTTSHITGQSSA
jgi:hypothetical protein